MKIHKNIPVSNIKFNEIKLCNCRNINECPLENRQMLNKKVVYKVTVISDKETTFPPSIQYIPVTYAKVALLATLNQLSKTN